MPSITLVLCMFLYVVYCLFFRNGLSLSLVSQTHACSSVIYFDPLILLLPCIKLLAVLNYVLLQLLMSGYIGGAMWKKFSCTDKRILSDKSSLSHCRRSCSTSLFSLRHKMLWRPHLHLTTTGGPVIVAVVLSSSLLPGTLSDKVCS